MGITVRDALNLGGLKKGEVIGGFEGLDNTVRYVSVLEITDDKVADPAFWYRGDELMISALYSVRDDVSAQIKVLERMAACSCAGLVLCHKGIYLKEISQELIDAANRLKIPLIVVPKEIGYIDIINPVLEEIINIQKKELEYTLNIQKRMTSLILKGEGLRNLACEISKILQCPSLIVDSDNNILAKNNYNRKGSILFDEVINNNRLCKELTENDQHKSIRIKSYECYSYPIRYGNNIFGRLLLFRDHPFDKLELVAIDEASKAVMLVIQRKITKREEMLRAKREFLGELLSGSIQNEEAALSRAEYFKIKISPQTTVMVIEIIDQKQQRAKNKGYEKHLKNQQNDIIRIIDSVLKYRVNYEVTTRGNSVVILMGSTENANPLTVHRAKEVGEQLVKEIASNNLDCLKIIAGIGNPSDELTKIHYSFTEAMKTIKVGKVLFDSTKCIHVSDLGIYYYLPELLGNKNIIKYINNTVSTLKDYDANKNTNLFETFKLLLFEDDICKVADRLFIHRNTLLYRKDKIKKILGIDPFTQPYKLNFQLTILLDQLNNIS